MADAAAARREARRRRILENSHNRLQLISGKEVDTVRNESPIMHTHTEDKDEASLTSELEGFSLPQLQLPILNNGAPAPNLDSLVFSLENQAVTAAGDSETSVQSPLASLLAPQQQPESNQPKSLLVKLVDSKYDIVILSATIQFLWSFSLFSPEETYFFLPLVLYDATKWAWFPSQTESKFASMVLMLKGISSNRALKIIKVWQWIQVLIQDSCVYLFTTICIQSLLISFTFLIT